MTLGSTGGRYSSGLAVVERGGHLGSKFRALHIRGAVVVGLGRKVGGDLVV